MTTEDFIRCFYLFGEGLGQDGNQVLQGPFGIEFTGVLRGSSLLRGLTLEGDVFFYFKSACKIHVLKF